MRIAIQLPTGLHSHAPGSRSVQHWENVAPGMALQSGRSAGRVSRAGSSTCRDGGANSSSTIEKLGTGGHLAPRICAAPAALSHEIRQPLGPTNRARRCPQPTRAMRVSAPREQSLENDVWRSESPSGRPDARAAAKSCEKHHLLLS